MAAIPPITRDVVDPTTPRPSTIPPDSELPSAGEVFLKAAGLGLVGGGLVGLMTGHGLSHEARGLRMLKGGLLGAAIVPGAGLAFAGGMAVTGKLDVSGIPPLATALASAGAVGAALAIPQVRHFIGQSSSQLAGTSLLTKVGYHAAGAALTGVALLGVSALAYAAVDAKFDGASAK